MLRDATQRPFDVLVCWRLDRLGRNLRHLVTLIEDLTSLGIGFVTLGEGIDTTTPTGRLQLHVLVALAEEVFGTGPADHFPLPSAASVSKIQANSGLIRAVDGGKGLSSVRDGA